MVMLAVAGTAVSLGGMWWAAFVVIVGAICFTEFFQLTLKITQNAWLRMLAFAFGAVYIGLAALSLIGLPFGVLLGVIAIVVATDTGAYFTGRKVGGPKIAPSISPSKTWSGLGGGAAVAGLVSAGVFIWNTQEIRLSAMVGAAFVIGAGLAILAQMGDFFESWLKRRAEVKDSSRLIPGHGGVFDRIDGLLPVAIAAHVLWALHPS